MADDGRASSDLHRRVLLLGVLASTALAAEACSRRGVSAVAGAAAGAEDASDVLPVEDLMREHGVLRRVLLIYEEVLHRMATRQPVPSDALPAAADVVRRFVEDYHERQEEEGVFPRFRDKGVLVDLVGTLQRQHVAGRQLTDVVLRHAAAAGRPSTGAGLELADAMRAFIRMYRPHAAREDTVLFPALRRVVTPREYDQLGDVFEDREHALFGEDGFEKMVDRVAAIERGLDIADLDAFTPTSPPAR